MGKWLAEYVKQENKRILLADCVGEYALMGLTSDNLGERVYRQFAAEQINHDA